MPQQTALTSFPAFQLLKCIAVVGMVLVHGFYWSWTVRALWLVPADSVWYSVYARGMGLGLCPLTLPLLAGVALRLRLPARPPGSGRCWSQALSRLVLHCLLLAVCGYAMNVLAAGWPVFWAWNVLQLVALSCLVVGGLYVTGGTWLVLMVAVLILGLSDPLRAWLPGASRGAILHVLLGDPRNWHQWPVVPWSATVAFGFVLADGYLAVNTARFAVYCLSLGGSVTGAATALGRLTPVFDPQHLIGTHIMQPPAIDVLGLVGVMLLAFGGLTAMQHRLRFSRHGVVHCFSGGILPIYLVHMIVGVQLYALTVRHLNPTAVMATLSAGWHPVLMLAFPVMLLLLSWGVGYGTVVWLHDKRFRIRLRCTALART